MSKNEEMPEKLSTARSPRKKPRIEMHRRQISAALKEFARAGESGSGDRDVERGVAAFLDAQPKFDISATSMHEALQHDSTLHSATPELRSKVVEHLKALQRVQAISPTAEAVPALIERGLTSAYQISRQGESTFLAAHSEALGPDVARSVYTNAVNARLANEQALMAMHEAVQGTGVRVIDGDSTKASRAASVQDLVNLYGAPFDLSALIGGIDQCACDDCTSVFSPTAYLVELFEFLRNNNLDPKNPNTGVKGYANTSLEQLFRRRPDLGCLQLTCKNSNTIVPWVDLATEVMESFVVHLPDYIADPHHPKQATLETYNVGDDDTSEALVAQPENVNYSAYCRLKSAPYPFALPYHQPIDDIRILLDFANTSREELLRTFATQLEDTSGLNLSPADNATVQSLHVEARQRAQQAEALGMTQEDYIILIDEAFWPKQYFDITSPPKTSNDDYRKKIGVLPLPAYYGYTSEQALLDTNEQARTGLTFVTQFLRRSGLQYAELVDVLRTRTINPGYPQGRALEVMESLRESYRAMQALVDSQAQNSKQRYAKLIQQLQTAKGLWPKIDALLHPDPCHQDVPIPSVSNEEIAQWVNCWFDRIGNLIVIETGDGPSLRITGVLHASPIEVIGGPGRLGQDVGLIRSDGAVVDSSGAVIGQVQIDGEVVATNGGALSELFPNELLSVIDPTSKRVIGIIVGRQLEGTDRSVGVWAPAQDSCDNQKARLLHLDGSAVTLEEYDRLQRFIRLRNRLGWSFDAVDKALIGYVSPANNGQIVMPPAPGGTPPANPPPIDGPAPPIDFGTFTDDCVKAPAGQTTSSPAGNVEPICPAPALAAYVITPQLIEQLGAIQKLQSETLVDLTSLLALWSDISTDGPGSLYTRLFLTYNVSGLDPIFESDVNGNFLIQPVKISDHVPALMAALQLTSAGLATIVAMRDIPDKLNLASLSIIYRHALLARIFGISAVELPRVLMLFGDPFKQPVDTLSFWKLWRKVVASGFTYRQIDYIVTGYDDLKQPLGPTLLDTLQLSKTICDGLRAIAANYPDPDPAHPEAITDDAVSTAAALLYDPATVAKIIALLNGQTVYSTNAPVYQANPPLLIPASLAGRVTYTLSTTNPVSAAVQVVGILSPSQMQDASNISAADLKWAAAIDRIGIQAQAAGGLFDAALAPVFTDAAAKSKLTAPDVVVSAAQIDPTQPDPNSAPAKRQFFLQAFMPFLRLRLGQQLIVDTMGADASLDSDVTLTLLRDILKIVVKIGSSAQSALGVLQGLADLPSVPIVPSALWKGYLLAPATDFFTLTVTSDQPLPQYPAKTTTMFNGQSLYFPNQQKDPSNLWDSDTVSLQRGRLYRLEIDPALLVSLSWQRATTARSAVPPGALLPDDATAAANDVIAAFRKAAIVIEGFSLDSDELRYLQANAADFDGLDFNKLTLPQWRRLQAFASLRDSLPGTGTRLIDFLNFCHQANDISLLPGAIAGATGWDLTTISSLIAPPHFNLFCFGSFYNERSLRKLQKAVTLSNKTGMDVDRLFAWADPTSQFWPCRSIAKAVRQSLQSRYSPTEWVQIVKPLNDKLREHQQRALVAYLVAQDPLVEWGAVDADSLFEFFLIDVQMCTCMDTTRIQQAIAAVQLYVWRCMQGLESKYVLPQTLDAGRWTWMSEYSPWLLNRKCFVYPEGSMQISLRDDKSSFYTSLESDLRQKDLDSIMIETLLKTYLYQVDEVANMVIVGLHLGLDSAGAPNALHVFARTRNVPNRPYYRSYKFINNPAEPTLGEWSPWELMPVEIPSYDVPDTAAASAAHLITGVLLTPVLWRDRLLVFFPEFTKKTAPDPKQAAQSFSDLGKKSSPSQSAQNEYWEIKLAWTERRNNSWTQKQVSTDRLLHAINDSHKPDNHLDFSQHRYYLPDLSKYLVVPRILNDTILLDIYLIDPTGPNAGRFSFSGNELHTVTSSTFLGPQFPNDWQFQQRVLANSSAVVSLQATELADPAYVDTSGGFAFLNEPSATELELKGTLESANSRFTVDLLSASNTTDTSGLYQLFRKLTSSANGSLNATDVLAESFGATDIAPAPAFNELRRPYSIYNWEFGFYAPLAVAAKLASSGQWKDAFDAIQLVFDPTSQDTDAQRFWKFPPFKLIPPEANVEAKLLALQSNATDPDITTWRNNPFDPFVVARSRPVAFMKWTVMQYVQMLIDRGDSYFRQFTFDTIQLAIQCYVQASHILGPRPQIIPKRGKINPESYCSLIDKWDAFGNAMVEMELLFPFSNQTSSLVVNSNNVVGLPNIFGFATSLYFCIPPNDELASVRALIDDRLYKIRHCEDINGVLRRLPLDGASANEALLELAASLGIELATALDDLTTPTPNYRFNYLLQKAYAFAAETKAMGSSYIATREKGDAEALASLRAAHETSFYQLTLAVREQQLQEANSALEALTQSRIGPVTRLEHYLLLIGADLGKVPAPDDTYDLLADPIDAPSIDSGLVLSEYEKEEMTMAADSALAHDAVGHLESIGGMLGLIPEFATYVSPFGVGATIDFGGRELSTFTQATARVAQLIADELSFQSSNAARKSGYLRQLQDRVLQANLAGVEIMAIDKQIATQNIRVQIATTERDNVKHQIVDAQAIEAFLHSKYTNTDLYDWMQTSLRTLHYQSYTLAYDMAARAQAVFHFERGASKPVYLSGGYWDDSRNGLFAAERLEIALKQIEADYVQNRNYDLEITRPPLSLKEIDPLALIELRATGSCTFKLSEPLFDREFPDQFMRRIKSLALDIPGVIGPGVSLSGKLTLLNHRFRTSAQTEGVGYAEDSSAGPDFRFSSFNVPIDAIAVCSGQNEHGAFELAFNGERYLPFEGAGVVSSWQLSLPPDFRPFDYETIADVNIRMLYVSKEGDARFTSQASQHYKDYVAANAEPFGPRDGPFVAFELARDFPDEWYRATQVNATNPRIFSIQSLADRLPYMARNLAGKPRDPKKLLANDIYFVFDPSLLIDPATVVFATNTKLAVDASVISSKAGLTAFSFTNAGGSPITASNWNFSFNLLEAFTGGGSAWLVVRYLML